MSAEKRSAVMARIRWRDTKPELAIERMLMTLDLAYESHSSDLPGRPDFVIKTARVAILVDGDFWHGWKFEGWRMKLSERWEAKIAGNVRRDVRNRRALRRLGWIVVRLWEHQVVNSPARCRARIRRAVSEGLHRPSAGGSVFPAADS